MRNDLVFDVEYPSASNRLTVLFRAPLAIPHLAWIALLAIPLFACTMLAWLVILLTGRHPRRLWEFGYAILAVAALSQAYLLVQRDEYPPFRVAPYPVVFRLAYPKEMSRLRTLGMPLMAVPQLAAMIAVFVGIHAVNALAWFAIVATGRHPRRCFDIVTNLSRWQHRVAVYVHLLTDHYPPFGGT